MLDWATCENEALINDLKDCFLCMYKFGGNDPEGYDYYSHCAYELLKVLSMRVTIGEFAVLKKQYFAAVYDGEWEDATEEKEN